MAVEQACSKLGQGEANDLRTEVKKAVKRTQNTPRVPSNITREENKALKELKKDKSRIILTTDKGVALVLMDQADYNKKAEELINTTYKKIPEDPTRRQKSKLINILKNIKAEGVLSEEAYKRMYPTGGVSPKFYGLPKIHKPGIPLRPIVSSTGTVTYSTAKELAKILKPLVGMATHHVHNTREFVEHLKGVRLKQGECIISYDVTAIFTSVPIQPVVNTIQQKLAKDKDVQQRTTMSIKHITRLLEFCLNSTSFVFQRQHYQRIEEAAMGSPLSPIVTNIFMENFEKRNPGNSTTPPKSVEEICR